MKHVSILVPNGAATLACIEGPFILFTRANDFLANLGKPPVFEVNLVGLTSKPQVYDKFFTVTPDHAIESIERTDLVIIPAVNGNMQEVIDANKEFLPWINHQHAKGAEVASLCVGAFILAATGLLNHKKCATHWMATNEFRRMYPAVNLVSEKIITDENGIYSSGGANSFWNLLIYLLEKFTSREIAIHAAKYFEIEIDRDSQSSFIMFKGQRDHQDESVRQAQEFIENNFDEKITVDDLSSRFAVGKRTLERRFKKATCNTVSEYIQRVKVEAAKKSFETSRKNINEIMYAVGYSDTKAFRTIFKKTTGLSPLEYRNKYNKDSISYNIN